VKSACSDRFFLPCRSCWSFIQHVQCCC